MACEPPFGAMFEASPLASCLTRARDGCFMAVNAAWESLFGVSRDAVLGRTADELGLWRCEEARAAIPEGASTHTKSCCMTVVGGMPKHVRIHMSQLSHDGERLLLSYFQDIGREVEVQAQRDHTQAALEATNRDLQSQVELHDAIESLALVGYWTTAQDSEEVFWSRGLCEIGGLTGRPPLWRRVARDGIHPDDRPAWVSAREAGDGRELEFRWVRPDGQVRWMRSRMGRTTVEGNPQTDFGVVQDITAQRDALAAQDEQLRLLRSITAQIPGVVFQARIWNDTGRFEFVSERSSEMFGVAPAELYGDPHTVYRHVHVDDRAGLRQSIFDGSRQTAHWRHVFRVELPGKGMRWYSAEGVPLREADGTVLWHGYVHDVSTTRKASMALERQHRMLDAVRQAQSAFIEAEDKRHAFEDLLQAFLTVTGSAFGFVGEVLYEEGGRPYLKTHAITNVSWDESTRQMYDELKDVGMEYRSPQTLFGQALLTGEPVIANDATSDPRRGGHPDGHPPIRSFLGIPVSMGERLVAMVGLANAPGGYRSADVKFLQPLLGSLRQMVLAWRDHTERLRSQQELQKTSVLLAEKSAALQMTLDSMSQGLTKVAADDRVTIYNRRYLELLDLPEELLARQPTHEEIVRFQRERGDFGADLTLVEPGARDYMTRRKQHAPERYWRRTRDGKTLEIRTRNLPEGGMVRTYSDVSSYIEAEEALREQRQRLEWVLDATGPGIWEMDLGTEVAKYSDRWASLLGFGLHELMPLTRDVWRSLVHPEDQGRAEDLLLAHLKGETPVYDCDLRMRHKSGDWLWFHERGRVHRRDASGQPLYMSGTLLDIHERVTAQEQVKALNTGLERRVAARTAELERSMRDMEVISYSIAHDLRAPLRSVNGFATLIAELDGDRLSDEGRLMFERIVSSSRNMGQMISDLLELVRVVRVDLEPVAVDMDALARTVIETLVPAVPQARVYASHLPAVLGDAKLLRQVLTNLLDNALKYSRHRPQPVIELGFDHKLRAFYLRDNGMGFDMAHAGKLFGLFQRLHSGSAAPGGTGVGLALVARTLERMGGSIWADARQGEGATFWWSLPLA